MSERLTDAQRATLLSARRGEISDADQSNLRALERAGLIERTGGAHGVLTERGAELARQMRAAQARENAPRGVKR